MITTATQINTRPQPGGAPQARYSLAALWPVALLTLGAAAIHFAVMPAHFDEWLPFGIFFMLVAAAQVALAVATVLRPSRRLFGTGAAMTAGVLGIWVVTRTVGLPIGPDSGTPEAVGVADVAAALLEVTALLRFAFLARGPRGPRPHGHGFWWGVRVALRAIGWALVLLLIGIVTYLGVGTGANGMPLAVNVSASVPGQPPIPLTSLTEPPGSQPIKSFTLTAEVTQIAGQTDWAYNGTVPGPELRVTQGDRLRVTLLNHLPVATTLHWHGIALPNAEDGVAGVTQNAVPPGNSFTYEFVVKDAGTYWYHSHQDTSGQIPRGLFGALIVEPRTAPAVAHDYVVLLHAPAGTNGVLVNGTIGDLHLAARPGDTVRLRLINAVAPGIDGGPEAPVLLGAPYRVVALDGRDLSGPQPLGPARLPLGMGQRADLLFTMPAAGSVRLINTEVKGGITNVGKVFVALSGPPLPPASVTLGEGAAPAVGDLASLPLFDPTQYGTPAADPVAAGPFDAIFPIVLSTNGGFRDGAVQLLHQINGQASPNVPAIIVHTGQVVRLHIVNDTDEYHPMHLHGHTLSVVAKNGRPLAGSPLHLDTVMVGPHETWDVAFLADNPGLWMFHCHVLLHAAFGMSVMVEYAGIVTPYEMGTRSGNIPE
ncbi:MAG: multicopper oxidase family protein [Chloroflexia bacterium]